MTEWSDFEIAVTAFVTALDPKAKVRHNVRVPDRDTGLPRQRDVWVEAVICGIFPVTVLISCKKWKRKLSEQDVDAFVGELESSGAHKGVLYSYAGFTRPAIAKAQARSISCCRLYRNQPADIPELLFLSFYCCATSVRLGVNSDALPALGDTTFGEVFDLPAAGHANAVGLLVALFKEAEKGAVGDATRRGAFPTGFRTAIQVEFKEPGARPLTVSLEGKWRIYRAKLEAHLLNGTYSFTEGQFSGSQTSPWIDRLGPDPGPGWELIDGPPASLQVGTGVVFLFAGDVERQLAELFRGKRLRELA